MAPKHIRCKTKDIERISTELKINRIPTPKRDKENESSLNFQPTEFTEESESQPKISQDQIISYPKKKNKLKSIEFYGKRAYTPFKAKMKVSTPHSILKKPSSTKSSNASKKGMGFSRSEDKNSVFPGTGKHSNIMLK